VIDLGTLKRIARTKGIKNIGYAEKDYFQEIILLGISREAPELVFKGGTALYKIHGLDRFSEDLDFSGKIKKTDIQRISTYLRDFGYENVVSEKKMKSGILLTFEIDGFLYQGTPETKSRVQMDVSEGDVRLRADWPQFFSLYPEIASFRIKVMTLEEIMAEKIRALLIRKKARHAYDIWFLLSKGVRIDKSLIQEKLDLYGIKLGKDPLKEALDECKRMWKRELKPMMVEVPDFKIIMSEIKKAMRDF
jgi:predicted nucleotidyltransferase component of viral defense system